MCVSKLVHLKRITDGGLRTEPPAAGGQGVWGRSPKSLGDFCNLLQKLAILN